jgi:carboxyl-terminal processing protease
MMERRKALALTVVLVFLSSIASFYAGAKGLVPQVSRLLAVPGAPAPSAAGGLDTARLQKAMGFIQSDFVDPITADKLTEGAIKGMVEATGDKYSVYFNPDEYKKFWDHLAASFSGIGVTVERSPKTGLITVVKPVKGSPGEKAGLKPGDQILAVDAKDVTDMTLDEAVQLIRGPKGTPVKLSVRREGEAQSLEFTVTRAEIAMPRVEAKIVDQASGTGYIQLTEFSDKVTEHVQQAITDLKSQGMQRLILDLRQDPGGILDEAVGVSSLFLPPKAPVVYIVYRNKEKETHLSRAKEAFNLPLVVLVDEMSASASEIVAGAVKDTKSGVLMGMKTFGKGSVQSFFPMPDGAGIKLTVAKYLTAGGNSIHEKGIDPDIVVKNPEKVLPGDPGDVQLQEAIKYIKTMKR